MQIEELMNDVDFQEQLKSVTTPEEVVELFAAKGFEVPIEAAAELFAPVSADGEMSAEALDNVAGGCVICDIRNFFNKFKPLMPKPGPLKPAPILPRKKR